MSSSRSERVDRLKQLRDSRLGKSKSKQYDDSDLYDEMEEEDGQYDEDFVVDDDNAGYIDNGHDDQQFSDEYEQKPEDTNNGKRKRTSKKDKTKEKEAPAKPSQQINRFFSNSALKAKAKPATPIDEEKAESFMNDLLSGFGSSKPVIANKSKHVKLNVATPALRRKLVIQQDDQDESYLLKKEPEPESYNSLLLADNKADEKHSDSYEAMDNDDFGNDMDYDDFDDIDEHHLKREVDKLSIQEAEPAKPNFTTVNKTLPNPDLQNWQSADAGVVDTFSQDEITIDTSKMDVLENDGNLKFWWYDAYERKEKGYVYLFGKALNKATNKYVSCCVTVKNIERNLFILPRKFALDDKGKETENEVEISDVYEEVSELFSKLRITKFASKEVTRKYAFELHDVPHETNYLKVLYSYEQPALEGKETGRTFSHVFGSNTGPLEHLLVKRDIMGPCWLEVKNAKISPVSETWCKVEISVDDPKTLNPCIDEDGNRPLHVPPLVVMSLCLRTIMNSVKNVNEIVAASAFVCNTVQVDDTTPIEEQSKTRFTVVRQLNNNPYPSGFNELVAKEKKMNGISIQVERTELSLLNFLVARIYMCDPDIIVGHNFAGFDLDVLLHRMKSLNTQHWHRLGRLKRTNWPKLQVGAGGAGESTFQERMIMSGRLVCDTYLASKDLIKSKSYRMTDLAQSQLKIAREDIEFGKSAEYFEKSGSLIHLLKHCAFDAYLASALMFKLQILPLTRQLTNLAGNLWSRTMTGARAERNEFLLLHEFHKAKYICPEKTFGGLKTAVVQAAEQDGDEDAVDLASNTKQKKNVSRRKPAYSGGLVLEPKKGFYDKYVLLLDFNSLYPSIIQEYNVCFTTVNRGTFTEGTGDNGQEKVPELPDETLPQGILPKLIKTLVDRRKAVKRAMNGKISQVEYNQMNIRQQALKLTANSMYGCLGFTHSRFYAKPLAMLITHKGREILQSTVNLAGNLEMNVIYGDTDSIMVYTGKDNIEEVKQMGATLRRAVNQHYKLLEIGIDGYYKHMLLLKKKKYAALLVEEKPDGELVESVETKGLDLVRRDWCDLSHDVSTHVLNLILSDRDREDVVAEIHAYLEIVAEQIRQGDITLEKYVINKQLTKRPQDYNDAKSLPHVQVALKLIQEGHNVKNGDTVPYVICKVDEETTGDKKGSALRAYHPDTVVKNNMQLDIEWYLHQQVHPPLTRICSPIEETDPARLAEYLGLDVKQYHFATHKNSHEEEEFVTLDSQTSDEERFKHAESLMLRCNHCGQDKIEYKSVIHEKEDGELASGLDCTKCHMCINEASLKVQLNLAIRKYITRYYDGWYVCDEDTCRNRTRTVSAFGRRCVVESCRGAIKREYSDKQLYTQLLYLSKMFDPVKAKEKHLGGILQMKAEVVINKHFKLLLACQIIVETYLGRSGYRHVDLSKLLSQVTFS